VQLNFTAKSHPTANTILPVQCISVVQTSLFPKQSLYVQFSAALLYSQVSSLSSHYTASSVQLCRTVKSYPTAVTILTVRCSSVVQPSLIPQQSLYCQFCAAMLYSQVSSHRSHYTASSGLLCCTTNSHPSTFTILPVLCSYVVQPILIPQQSLYCQFNAALLYSHVSTLSSHYTASSVQLCCTAKSHPTAVTVLPVQSFSVVQPSLIPQLSLYCQFSAALLYSQVSSLSSLYTASSVQLCCTTKSHPTAVTILPVKCSCVVQTSLIPQQSL